MAQNKKGKGRPPALNEGDRLKIVRAATAGMKIPEISAYLSVSKTALTNFLAKNPKFKDEVETLKNRPKSLAKLIILDSLENGSVDVAKWVLERDVKLAGERERLRLVRVQRKALENTVIPQNAPEGLMSDYWERVNNYFCNRENEEKSDNSIVDKG